MQDILKLAEQVGRALQEKGLLLSTAESCTGGGIAQAMTAVPGSSAWFVGGFVSYANDCKVSMLDVSADDLASHGAVSDVVARAMATGALAKAHADIAVATTGIAGPDGGVPGKPVGTVWMACANPTQVVTDCQLFSGDRASVREKAIAHALNMVLQCVQVMPAKG